ncbi:DUF58 domain-containing protein [Sulfurovum sp. CS9]|uniref:DUF58 domain-containing protein n=1 Tax=Sulfurovum sp. CS9 TaxID=3391146 RepID=UPI0039E95746
MRIDEKRDENGVYVTLNELLKFGHVAKGFSFLPSQPVHSILSGRHGSKVRGRGMDFSEMKQYVQGDDPRSMDWKATRRTGKPYIRVFNEERDRNVWLVVSQRNSMFFGTKMMMKSVAAAHLTAISAFRVVGSGDRVGAVVYNDETLKFFKPQRSKQGVIHILSEVVKQNQALHASNSNNTKDRLNEALKIVSATAKHDDLVILIGDGRAMDEESTRYITALSAHNDVIAALVYDPMEKELHASGSLFLSDGTVSVDVDSSSQSFQKRFSGRMEERVEGLMHLSKKHTIPLFSISTERPVLDQVQEQLGAAVSAKRRV